MAQEQVEIEFRNEIQQLQQMQQADATKSTNGSTDANAS